jgi:hypothetical protein
MPLTPDLACRARGARHAGVAWRLHLRASARPRGSWIGIPVRLGTGR